MKEQEYIIIYRDEAEFRRLEKSLKKINFPAWKQLIFEIIPTLKRGDFHACFEDEDKYYINLCTLPEFKKVYDQIRLIFEIADQNVILDEISPKKELLSFLVGYELDQGCPIAYNDAKSKFKLNIAKMVEDYSKAIEDLPKPDLEEDKINLIHDKKFCHYLKYISENFGKAGYVDYFTDLTAEDLEIFLQAESLWLSPCDEDIDLVKTILNK